MVLLSEGNWLQGEGQVGRSRENSVRHERTYPRASQLSRHQNWGIHPVEVGKAVIDLY